jgi:Fe-S cluster biogenesis protein NfuA
MSTTARRPVSVYAEQTPNPATMKFVSTFPLLPGGKSVEYTGIEETENCPLAARLFSFPFVSGIFISGNFITITRQGDVEWQEIFPELREYIQNFLMLGYPIFEKEPEGEIDKDTIEAAPQADNSTSAHAIPSDDIEARIIALLDDYVAPAVAGDGGAIYFHHFDKSNGRLTLTLRGSCNGCPSATVTLRNGVQSLFERMMPEVREVVAL